MAQVDLWGATYNNVPAINVPSGNGTARFTDTSDATATSDKILQGYTAYGADGSKLTGTATAGGGSVTQDQDGYIVLPATGGGTPTPSGGLEYESGTWVPSTDVADAWISFTNTHTGAPFFYMIVDVGTTYNSTSESNAGVFYYNWGQVFGEPFHYSSSSVRYGYARLLNGTGSQSTASITYPPTATEDSAKTYPRHWAKETGIKAEQYTSDYYWRSTRTYKWIAVWAPTT